MSEGFEQRKVMIEVDARVYPDTDRGLIDAIVWEAGRKPGRELFTWCSEESSNYLVRGVSHVNAGGGYVVIDFGKEAKESVLNMEDDDTVGCPRCEGSGERLLDQFQCEDCGARFEVREVDHA